MYTCIYVHIYIYTHTKNSPFWKTPRWDPRRSAAAGGAVLGAATPVVKSNELKYMN